MAFVYLQHMQQKEACLGNDQQWERNPENWVLSWHVIIIILQIVPLEKSDQEFTGLTRKEPQHQDTTNLGTGEQSQQTDWLTVWVTEWLSDQEPIMSSSASMWVTKPPKLTFLRRKSQNQRSFEFKVSLDEWLHLRRKAILLLLLPEIWGSFKVWTCREDRSKQSLCT